MLRGYVVFHNPGALREFLLKQLAGGASAKFRILYVPRIGDLQEHFESVLKLVLSYGKNGPGLILGVDEIDQFCENGKIKVPPRKPGEPPRRPALKDVVNYGRHRRISMSCTSRQPAQVARELTGQCGEIRCFRMTEPNEIQYFASLMGQNSANGLPSLGQYQYLKWTDDGAEPKICGGKI